MNTLIIAVMLSMVTVGTGISLSASIGGSLSASATSNNAITYANPSFTFEYPSNWTNQESVTLMSPQTTSFDTTREVINIQTESLPPGTTLSEYTQSGINQLTSLPRQNFSIIDSSFTTLAGLPAHTVTHTFNEDGINKQLVQIWAVDNSTDTSYVITYGTTVEEFNDGLPVLQSITDTFQLQYSNDSESGIIEGN
jgi:hypothetical protein